MSTARYTQDELIRALQRVALEYDRPITVSLYNDYRDKHPELGLPTVMTFVHRFGSWRKAQSAAALPQNSSSRASVAHIPDDRAIAAVKAAAARNNGRITRDTYNKYRRIGDPSLYALTLNRKWLDLLRLAKLR